jgi:ectoine hydroxylase-related dioxygenase (phytanoyl-CoA dioxygenase family)
MRLEPELVKLYEEQGYLILPSVFATSAISRLKVEIAQLCAESSPNRFLEKDGDAVRSIYGAHLANDLFKNLTVNPKLLGAAKQILREDVYCYQSKINTKRAFSGELWEWHQDLIYWLDQDGLPDGKMINIAVFFDDVTEFNGPIFAVPGSHRSGVLARVGELPGARPMSWQPQDPEWRAKHAARLKDYLLDGDTVSNAVKQRGIVSLKGTAGSVVIFHPNLVHASTHNISPYDRAMIILTYNSTSNLPRDIGARRPEFFASRDHRPLVARGDARLDE